MTLADFFGDDEHTAVDGPYKRLMKTRKWIFLSSGLSGIVAMHLYDPSAFKALIKVVQVPESTLAGALFLGVVYLWLTYTALLVQLSSTYRYIVRERFAFRRADELSEAKSRVVESARKIANFENALSEPPSDKEMASAGSNLDRLLSELEDADEEIMNHEDGSMHQMVAQERARVLKDEVSKARSQVSALLDRRREWENSDNHRLAQRQALIDDQFAAAALVAELEREDPAQKRRYRYSEFTIDFLRLAPAWCAGLLGLTNLVIAFVVEPMR